MNQRGLYDHILLIVKGLAMGIANKVPGVSGGIVAIVTGFYPEFLYSLKRLNFKAFYMLLTGRFKQFYQYTNALFLLLIALGILLSYFTVSRVLDIALLHYEQHVKGLFFGNVDEDATIKAAQELVFMRVRREDLERLAKAKKYVGSSGGIQFNDYVTEVDRILNETVYAFDSDKTPKRMFDGVEERNEERGKQENKSHAGLKTPFSEYDAYFRKLRKAICAKI